MSGWTCGDCRFWLSEKCTRNDAPRQGEWVTPHTGACEYFDSAFTSQRYSAMADEEERDEVWEDREDDDGQPDPYRSDSTPSYSMFDTDDWDTTQEDSSGGHSTSSYSAYKTNHSQSSSSSGTASTHILTSEQRKTVLTIILLFILLFIPVAILVVLVVGFFGILSTEGMDYISMESMVKYATGLLTSSQVAGGISLIVIDAVDIGLCACVYVITKKRRKSR